MRPETDYSLYLVTDSGLMSTETVEESVELAILGGASLVQLREKSASSREFYETAVKLREITRRFGVPLIINDRADIAMAVDADGVHVGQSDIPARELRRMIGPDKLLGVSASNFAEAAEGYADGADYLGVGAMFATGTKSDASLTSMEELERIKNDLPLPIVVIGGIGLHNARDFGRAGVDGLAVVSAIVARADITAAARELRAEFLRGRAER